jgi:hypothetical protein
MTTMENEITKALNLYYRQNKIKALAHRLYQSEFSRGQFADFLSDSRLEKFYFACECKSIDYTKYNSLNFKSRFSESDGIHQLEKEHFFIEQTGRKGYLAVECRQGPGKTKECYWVDMNYVYNKWKSGEKSLKIKEIRDFPKIERKGGKYLINDDLFA